MTDPQAHPEPPAQPEPVDSDESAPSGAPGSDVPDDFAASSADDPAPEDSAAENRAVDEQVAENWAAENWPAEPEWPAETPEPGGAGAAGTGRAAPRSTTPLGCTIAVRGQLPAARVLRDSFLRNHPGAGFVLLVLDWPQAVDQREEGVLTPVDIGVDAVEFARLATACTAEQLRTVLRPRLMSRLLRSGSTVLFLEPSVQVFGRFDDLLAGLNSERPVGLVPRVLHPLRTDGLRPSAADLAEAGTFDPSVLAACPGAEDFLAAWSEQLRADPAPAGMFLDGAPALVDHEVVRHPGVGLSAWNAAQRELVASEQGHTVDGAPLRSVHFEGFRPQRPWLLSVTYADRPRVLLSEHPALARLCAGYRNALVDAGHTRDEPYPFDALPDGSVLPDALRREYFEAWSWSGEAPASPFEPENAEYEPVAAFLAWACAPVDQHQRAAGGSRWTAAVWADDPVLRRDYPDPFGADAEAFHEWAVGAGVASGRIPAAAVHQRDSQRTALVDQLGVSVLGRGALAELVRAAVRSSGLPSSDVPHYPVVLRCDSDASVPAGRYLVDVRSDRDGSGQASETWVCSETSRNALRLASGTGARVVGLPVPDPGRATLSTRKGERARHGISEEFVIGTAVDHADEHQANVLGVVSAFFAAFPESEPARLLVRVSGAAERPEAAERLRLATASDPRVILVEDGGDVTSEDALLQAADCVLSLHRGDGASADAYALRLREIAARGVPVLAGDHGAVSELLGGEAARLVPCRGGAEPDVDAAASRLREAADDPEGLAEFGLAAREHLITGYSTSWAGERLRERVEHAYRNWRTKWAKDKYGELDDPLHPLLVARHALHRAPDVSMGSRNAMTPALRRAVLKALGHYDEHLRDVLRSMVDGVEQTAAELLRRQYDADGGGDVESLRNELAQLGQRHDQLAAQFVGSDDGVVRARADLAEQHRRIAELEQRESERAARGGSEHGDSSGVNERIDALTERLETLTSAVESTMNRLDALEREDSGTARQTELESGLRSASQDANYALQRTDVLQRVLLREHERNNGSGDDGTSAPVLCDAGLLRLPADDSMMLPWLSSHASWDAEVSALIDSLLEPDGIFLDVGSYVGYQATRVLSRMGNSGAVVAVEPFKRSHELLRRNVEVNAPPGCADHLTVIEAAAWDAHCELRSEPALAGGLSVRPAEAGEEPGSVRAVRLDRELETMAALEGLGLSVVHVDVGGCVHRVLGGLVRLLRRDRPSIVCSFTPSAIEELGADPAAALREFGTWGYDLVPVGRSEAVGPEELLGAMSSSSASTVKLWLRPRSSSSRSGADPVASF